MKDNNSVIIEAELRRLHEAKKNGVISAEDIVHAARDPESPLHHCFPWDDEYAAHQYRLKIARKILVRYKVTLVGNTTLTVPYRVSLLQDRKLPGGGYRVTEDVIRDPDLRAELMHTAIVEFRALLKRYSMFKELCERVEKVLKRFDRPEI